MLLQWLWRPPERWPAAAATMNTADSDSTGVPAHRWSRFACLCIDGTWRRICICLADAKGCQVWDIEDAGDIRLLAQLQVRGVSCVAPLHTKETQVDECSALSDLSILAVGATDGDGATTLAFYSLADGEFVHVNPVELASIQAAVDRLFAGHADDGEPHRAQPRLRLSARLRWMTPLPGSTMLQVRLPGPVCDLISAAPIWWLLSRVQWLCFIAVQRCRQVGSGSAQPPALK